jgi:MFS family permease
MHDHHIDDIGPAMTETRDVQVNPGGSPASRRTNGLLLAVVSATILFDALDLSITQIALPSIQASLRVATSTLPWVAAGYVVTYGGFLLLGGRASDLLGARRVFLAGLATFGAASLACGCAGDAAVLIAARAVQGIGAALTVPAAITILATAFTEERARTRAFGVFAAAAASGFSAGLVLGGLLTSGLSWRWIFLAKVPAVALVLLAALRAVPASRRRTGGRYDLAGAVTGTGGAVLLTYGVTRAGAADASTADITLPIVGAVALLAVFVLVERRGRAPLLPAGLLRVRGLAAADAAALTVLAAPFGVSFVVTVYLQDVLHRSPWHTALTLLPGAMLCAVVARYLAPPLLNHLGLRAVYGGGLVVVAAGDAVLVALGASNWSWLVVTATLVSFGIGMGLAYPAATVGGVRGVAPQDQGAAAGLNNTALQVGGAIGLAVVATAVNIGLGGRSPAEVGAAAAQDAARYGALAATVLPLLGAAVVLFGRVPSTHRE